MSTCAHCPTEAVTNLDGDPLCKRHADEWVRAEGAHAAYMEAEERWHEEGQSQGLVP